MQAGYDVTNSRTEGEASAVHAAVPALAIDPKRAISKAWRSVPIMSMQV